jgi:hypothetical protein
MIPRTQAIGPVIRTVVLAYHDHVAVAEVSIATIVPIVVALVADLGATVSPPPVSRLGLIDKDCPTQHYTGDYD